MSPPNAKKSTKILMLGLAESGKTTIIKVVTEGYKPEKKAKYTATLNYDRKNITLLGNPLTVFDLGGQVSFLDRFTGELADFIFSDVTALIFVVDIVNISELSRAKYYFSLALENLAKRSSTAIIYVLFHKIDLINQGKLNEISLNIKSYLTTDLPSKISVRYFFTTSIFSESIFKAFGKIFAEISGTKSSLADLTSSFIRKYNHVVKTAQIFTETGVPLLDSTSFSNISVSHTRTMLNTFMEYTSRKKNLVSGTFVESQDEAYIIRFLDNDVALMFGFNKKDLIERNITCSMLYDELDSICCKAME